MRVFLFIFLCTFSLFAGDQPAGERVESTPYDAFLAPVRAVLHKSFRNERSFARVSALMERGYSFRYEFTDPYRIALPSVTVATGTGDCKAKSLWLASKLRDTSIRFVIGKAHSDSVINHAWLTWRHDNRVWILDPTNNSKPIAVESVSPGEYLPLYVYDKRGAVQMSSEPGNDFKIATASRESR